MCNDRLPKLASHQPKRTQLKQGNSKTGYEVGTGVQWQYATSWTETISGLIKYSQM
jgi:hypothetical protein